METKHTPGPYFAKTADRVPYIIAANGGFALKLGKRWDTTEGWATARLLAAAPKLLEALQEIVSDNEFCGDSWGVRRDAWIETAKKAIESATERYVFDEIP